MGSISPPSEEKYDVLIIGAGLSGLYSLINFRQRFPDWRIGIIEAGSDVGGTWYFNSYPGCRFDSESISYAYSFDKDVLEQWHWKEAFSPQPETHKYIQHVATKHDCYKDIKFDTRITTAYWEESDRTWTFIDESGSKYITKFYVSCMGFLSAPTLPAIPGVKSFKGQSFHTSQWPKNVDIATEFRNKKIGVIGTGATGIQTITALSEIPNIKSLSVFQRTANWSAPLRNFEITSEQMTAYRSNFGQTFQQCFNTPTGFLHRADPRNSLDVSDEERLELWEKLYAEPGFGKWLGVFKDTYTNREANALYTNFMADKIRQRVNDPEVANSLVPNDHGFGLRRVPLESGYFEAYNQSNVHLVDLKKTPITKVTETGIETSEKHHDLDILIYATGFDAITGAFTAIDWHAKDGRPLTGMTGTKQGERAIWQDHRPSTFLGMTIPSMPNTFMVLGPHQPFGNATRSIEHAVVVISDMLQYCKDNGITYIEPKQEAVDDWGQHVVDCSKGALLNDIDSWMTGVNKNVKGKTVRSVARYSGPMQEFRRRCHEARDQGYTSFILA